MNTMVRDLTTEEMELISGGSGSMEEIVVTGTRSGGGGMSYSGSSSSGSSSGGGAGSNQSTAPQDLQDIGTTMMAAGAIIAASDGPLPVADTVGIPVAGAGGIIGGFGRLLEALTP